MACNTRRGFTLIELLVVIAIISILASILFPVFARARAKGRQTACISNVYQICMAINMYSQDYDERTVNGDSDGDPNTLDDQWYNSIFAYTRNRQIMFCPDRPDSGPGYGLNWLASGCAIGNYWDPSRKILIADAPPEFIQGDGKVSRVNRWWMNDPGNDLCMAGAGFTGPADDSFTGNGYPQRHNDGLVYGFADGHAKWAREDQMDNAIAWAPAVASE
jgi:prepilin-type N-terminal cleavage/methylation domain-containing protein/prepilin-type processing-associated H-X9-DG protein